MMVFILNFLYLLFSIFVIFFSYIFYSVLPSKIKKWIKLKTAFTQTSYNLNVQKKTYWFHAASGEIEYAKSIIRELRVKQHHEIQIVVTYSSPSAPVLFQNIAQDVDVFIPLCWDLDILNNQLIKIINPTIVIFARTDFWPRLIYNLKRQNIPIAAISMFPQIKGWHKVWLKFVLEPLTFISCVSPSSQLELKKILLHQHVEFIPDTRFDQVNHRLSLPSKINIQNSSDIKLMVIGSSWPQDEEILIQTFQSILKFGYKIIWAPHETHHTQQLISRIKATDANCRLQLLSQLDQQQLDFKNCDILIVDQIGYLADFYRFSSFAFIGGSFVKKVHSVMEPLCAFNPVIVGPFHKNSPEALYFKVKQAVISVENPEQFIAALTQIHSDHVKLKKIIQTEIKNFTGGTQKIVAQIDSVITLQSKK